MFRHAVVLLIAVIETYAQFELLQVGIYSICPNRFGVVFDHCRHVNERYMYLLLAVSKKSLYQIEISWLNIVLRLEENEL